MSTSAALREALKAMQELVESELVASLRTATSDSVATWPVYERQSAFDQTTKLGEGSDCNYDRPTVGVAYALWYMPRRIQDAIRALFPYFAMNKTDQLTILDLGCGTGATWWACRYLMIAAQKVGIDTPTVRIIGCDTSPPMLNLGNQMWDSVQSHKSLPIEVVAKLTSWTNISDIPPGSIIFASYLLDQSDSLRIDELGRMLRRIADRSMSRDVVIIGANNKRKITKHGIDSFQGDGSDWVRTKSSVIEPFWNGTIPEMRDLRIRFAQGCSGATLSYSASKYPSWNHDNPDFNLLSRCEYETLIPTDVSNLFVLDSSQELAATPDGRLTAILGAAGSGKSRVLVERLVRTIHVDLKRADSSKYLVTCFNRAVVQQLRAWFLERCDADFRLSGRIDHGRGLESVHVDQRISIDFLTWDTVIKRKFNLPSDEPSTESEAVMTAIIDNWSKADPVRTAWLEGNSWLTPQFVLQEMKRVIYGQGVTSLDDYIRATRHRRPSVPQMNERRRREIWEMISDRRRPRLWIDRRIAAHQKLGKGFIPERYERIFLDECQDFVTADFDMLNSLVEDANRIVVCGDGTQALQTGIGYCRPRTVGNRRWETHELKGSYRLPVRICEAIEPIARAIQSLHADVAGSGQHESDLEDVTLPESVKSAVIGCRPIIMACDEIDEFSLQLSQILRFIAPLVEQHGSLVITNADEVNKTVSLGVRKAITQSGLPYTFESNSMLRIKGLERPCVFFSTFFEGEKVPGASQDEWIYTILTRPTSVLIIFLSRSTLPAVRQLIGKLRSDCIFFWDEAAEIRFREFSRPEQSH